MAYPKNVEGFDVSHWQGKVNFNAIKRAGGKFAFVKATDGLKNIDSEFMRNWPAIFFAGIKVRGAYHYAHIESDPVQQATHYVLTVTKAGGFHKGDFAILDAEDVCAASQRIGTAATATWCRDFVETVQKLTGLPNSRILIYTGAWWWGPRAGNSTVLTNYPLWLSAYSTEAAIAKREDWQPWRIHRFWQYTDKRTVPGVGSIDASYFNGSYRALKKMAGVRHWWLP